MMRSDVLQVCGGKLAALAHHVVGELLALVEIAHSRALDRGNMDEHVLSAIRRLDESEALLRIEKLHGAFSHVWPPLKNAGRRSWPHDHRAAFSPNSALSLGAPWWANSKSRQNLEPAPYIWTPAHLQSGRSPNLAQPSPSVTGRFLRTLGDSRLRSAFLRWEGHHRSVVRPP